VAKLRTPATLIGYESREWDGKTFSTAHVAFPEEGGMVAALPLNCSAEVVNDLKKLPQFCKGIATVALRSIKGSTYIDLAGFEVTK